MPESTVLPLPLSSHSGDGLRRRARALAARLAGEPGDGPPPARQGAPVYPEHRAVLLYSDRADCLAGLRRLAAGETSPQVVRGVAAESAQPVLVFPGLGAQSPAMGRGLLADAPVFTRRIEECDRALRPHTGWSLPGLLSGAPGAPSMDRMDVCQPALFAVTVSLAALWRSYGVRPAAVIGHSIGEFAAAHEAGALTLEDAARVCASWGRAQASLAGTGELIAVRLPVTETAARLRTWPGLTVAAVNGPRSVVVSGDREAAERFLAGLVADRVGALRVPAGYAAHSPPHMTALRERQLADLAGVTGRSGAVPFYSTVTGRLLDTALLDPAYWYRNLSGPVRFEAAVRAAALRGHAVFIEVGPHPVLTLGMRQTLETIHERPAVVASAVRSDGSPGRFLRSVAEAYVAGVPIDWTAAYAGVDVGAIGLPLPVLAPAPHPGGAPSPSRSA
ncbi:acyltransferase domain-containing protein [Streptomyces avicenniae]|uniref:acyltransferase domain-containing protein n=1 Tax=Streptomyces avicenniae TaxID=500153 RepID=UPI00069A8BFA|nr:acyltransferase domain-containing protein [Streptomyces avicenniae]